MVTKRRPGARHAANVAAPIGMVLRIQNTTYGVDRLPCDPEAAQRLYRLRKPDGTGYHVAQTGYGPECDCPDFLFRRAGLDPSGCKHVRALVAYGLLHNPHDPGLETPRSRSILRLSEPLEALR
jgi:hypothetical protein